MSFTTLSGLLSLHESATPITEDQDEYGMGPKPHPVLSRAEIVRFYDKIDQARNKLEEIESIFKHAPGATGQAHKLHHIGVKAGGDMGALDAVHSAIETLFNAVDDLHQAWGTGMQQDTGAFDEPAEPAPEDETPPDEDLDGAPTDLPPEEEPTP
jgi:hypothetical protein